MDLEPFHRGVYQVMVSIGLVVSATFTPLISPTTEIASPTNQKIENLNLSSETISSLEDTQQIQFSLEESTKKAEELKVVKIEPEPTPSVTPSPSPIPIVEKIKKPLPKAEVSIIVSEKKTDENIQIEPKKETPLETPVPTPTINQNLSGADKLFELTNQYRLQKSLPIFDKDEAICKIAEQRAPQVYDEVFTNGPMHKGFHALNLLYWATENIASYQTIEENFNFLITDYIHRKSIEGDYKYSCVACSNTSCSQIFTSYIPK